MDTYDTQLTILGSSGDMYSESLDLHAASPLHQCFSLEGLDRYFLCSCVSGVHSCVAVAFFGLGD